MKQPQKAVVRNPKRGYRQKSISTIRQPQKAVADDRFNRFIEEARNRKWRWVHRELTEEEIRVLKQYWDCTGQGQLVFSIDADKIQRVIGGKDAAIPKENRTRLIEIIEKNLNCRLDPLLQNKIIYFFEKFFMESKTNASKMRKELTALRKNIKPLIESFASINFLAREALKGEDTVEGPMRDSLFDRVMEDLPKMQSRIEKKLSILSKKRGGPNPNWALHALIAYLGGLYEEHTKERPGRWGNFYRFVRECLDCVKIRIYSENSIDGVIRTYNDFVKSGYK